MGSYFDLLFDTSVHLGIEGLETCLNTEQQLFMRRMVASVVDKNNFTPITRKEHAGTPQFSYSPACIEWDFTEEAARTEFASPVETKALLPGSQVGLKQNIVSADTMLPLSSEEIQKTIATLECDPSFSARVLQQAHSGNPYNLGYLKNSQQFWSELDFYRGQINYHFNLERPRSDRTQLELLRNSGVYQVETQGQFLGRKRAHSCDGDSEKDELYWEKRKKNNEAAKKSRDAKRVKEIRIQKKAIFLEEENKRLRFELSILKEENEKLKENSSLP